MVIFILGRSSSYLQKFTINYFYRSSFSEFPLSPIVYVSQKIHTYAATPWTRPVFLSVRGFHSGIPLKAGLSEADCSDSEEKRACTDPDDKALEISMIGISLDMVEALAAKGITKLFPIQRAVLNPAIQRKDVIGRAKTGTGKTLAYGIPIMDRIMKFNAKYGAGKNPLALVLSPTRELAKQVEKELADAAPKLETLCVYGGVPVLTHKIPLKRGVDVVVGTPGRVIDLIQRSFLNVSQLQFVVLDEADQLLGVNFIDYIETVLGYVTQKHQTMLFSATTPCWVEGVMQRFIKNPVIIDLVREYNNKLPDGISLYAIMSDAKEKAAVVDHLITEHGNGGRCLVFTRKTSDVERLTWSLQRNFKCKALHSRVSQDQRDMITSSFRKGSIDIVVATDIAARGLDIPNVELVIHYDRPSCSDMFIHRSGRTGRAGKKGTVILINPVGEESDLESFEQVVGCKFVKLPSISGAAAATPVDASPSGDSGRFHNNESEHSFVGYGNPDGVPDFGLPGGFGNSGGCLYFRGGLKDYENGHSSKFGNYNDRLGFALDFNEKKSPRKSGNFSRSNRSSDLGPDSSTESGNSQSEQYSYSSAHSFGERSSYSGYESRDLSSEYGNSGIGGPWFSDYESGHLGGYENPYAGHYGGPTYYS